MNQPFFFRTASGFLVDASSFIQECMDGLLRLEVAGSGVPEVTVSIVVVWGGKGWRREEKYTDREKNRSDFLLGIYQYTVYSSVDHQLHRTTFCELKNARSS